MRSLSPLQNNTVVTIALMLLSSCGGGGGNSTSNSPENGPEKGQQNQGYIYYTQVGSANGLYRLDLASRKTENLLPLCCDQGEYDLPDYATVHDDNTIIAFTEDNLGQQLYADIIDTQTGENELVELQVQISGGFPFMRVELSPDRSVIVTKVPSSHAGTILGLFDQSGSLIWSYEQSSSMDENGHFYNQINAWSWAKNGFLYIAHGDTLYRVDTSNSLDKKAFRTFPDYELYTTLEVSPDQNQLLFSMGRYPVDISSNDIGLYTMDLATGSVKQIAKTNESIRQANWSPDGKQIVLSKGTNFHHAGAIEPCLAALFIIPSDVDKVIDIDKISEQALYGYDASGELSLICMTQDELAWRIK